MLYKEMGRLEPTRRRLLVASHPDRYILDDPNVFPTAIGRSFYESVLPPSSVHLGWSSYAAVWLSRVPTLIPGHFIALASTGPVRAEFDRQAAKDWEVFLSLRARELRPGCSASCAPRGRVGGLPKHYGSSECGAGRDGR